MTEPRPLNFTEQYIKKSSEPFHYIKGMDVNGEACYHILMAPKSRIEALMNVQDEEVDLAHYGKVVASEYGHYPSEGVKEMLKENYGIDFDDYFKIDK